MRLIFAFLLLSSNVLGEEITVTVDTNGKSEYQIRQEAKRKVSIEMLDRMPAIISGRETLTNGSLTSSIQSLTLSAVDVVPIEERWNRQNQRYMLTAHASVDEERVQALFEDMQINAEMKKLLKQSFSLISELQSQLNNEESSETSRPVQGDASNLSDVPSLKSNDTILSGFAQQVALIEAGMVDDVGIFNFRRESSKYFLHSLFIPYKNSYTIKTQRGESRDKMRFVLSASASTKEHFNNIQRYNNAVPYMKYTHICLGNRVDIDKKEMKRSDLTFTLEIKEDYKDVVGDPVIYPC